MPDVERYTSISPIGMRHPQARVDPCDYSTLHPLGIVSQWLGARALRSHLKPGNWLDLLSGESAELQLRLGSDPKITSYYALDLHVEAHPANQSLLPVQARIDASIPFQTSSIDNITIINGLEHLWLDQDVVTDCWRVLRPNGILQIVVPTWFGKPFLEFLAFRMKDKQAFIEMNDHKTYYDERQLWPMLVRAGFMPSTISMRRIKFFCSIHAVAVKQVEGS
jgi:SAM-dependent methyltransferase